ncbi:carboxyl-terminal processing protease [Thermanaeromonas toyohensis ToBE]|uniref:Carboxyl-terminal processing protease n=1 Tax=Thermanaeromonas toyohensis ToBE TaxID=698762 RepID=A0A1W1VAF7_9FIRM|nr:S41 family peptidase [Thermanaeromonas toyohensis]SMB90031.1 carboxyl-terminal processing protease [Thermanaeromonas toyohensis ToBE]
MPKKFMAKGKDWLFTFILGAALMAFLFAFLLGRPAPALAREGDSFWPLLFEVRELIEKHYAGEIDPYALEEGAIQGMLESLRDPYSEYFSPQKIKLYQKALEQEYSGVGLVLQEEGGIFTIVGIIPSSPAARQGLRPGGVLLKIDGQPVQGRTLEEVKGLLQGEVGTEVLLEIAWPWEGVPRTFTLKREFLRQQVVRAQALDGQLGYLGLTSFTTWMPEEAARALDYFKASGVKGIILDLRGNSGGYLQAAVEVASLFLPPGAPVAQVVNKAGQVEILRSAGPGLDLPLVVLVDKDTASAAELLAGALQDAGLAYLVGTRTYGKGSIQSIIPLSNGGALKLTTGHYLTPAGREIEAQGLKPDKEIEDREEQFRYARDLLLKQERPAA